MSRYDCRWHIVVQNVYFWGPAIILVWFWLC